METFFRERWYLLMELRTLTALPVYNEAAHLVPVLEQVGKWADDILVIDDGSTDDTPAVLRGLSGIQVLTHSPNRGYGAALQSAFDYAIAHGYEALVTIDCDGQHEPSLIPELVAQLQQPAWPLMNASALTEGSPRSGGPGSAPRRSALPDIVSGSRYLELFPEDSQPPADRRKINIHVTDRINTALGLQLTDAFCGFKAYRVDALRRLTITEDGYAMPLQLWVQAVARGLSISEFPVPLIYLDEERSFGGSLDDSRRRLAYYEDVLLRELTTAEWPVPQVAPVQCAPVDSCTPCSRNAGR